MTTAAEALNAFAEARVRAENAIANSKDANRLCREYLELPLANLEESSLLCLQLKKRGVLQPAHVTCLMLDIEELNTEVTVGEQMIGRTDR